MAPPPPLRQRKSPLTGQSRIFRACGGGRGQAVASYGGSCFPAAVRPNRWQPVFNATNGEQEDLSFSLVTLLLVLWLDFCSAAPEQRELHIFDRLSDIRSLIILIYRLVFWGFFSPSCCFSTNRFWISIPKLRERPGDRRDSVLVFSPYPLLFVRGEKTFRHWNIVCVCVCVATGAAPRSGPLSHGPVRPCKEIPVG